MMIFEVALPDQLDPACAQRPEKTHGIANPGKRQHALAGKPRYRGRIRLEMPPQHRFAARGDRGRGFVRRRPVANHDQRIGAVKLRR